MRRRNGSPAASGLKTPRRRADPAGRHEALLQQVAEVFFREGFTGTSMDQLAEGLRCSKTTLYALASSKEALVVRITKRFFAVSAYAIEASIAQVTDPGEQILEYFHGVGTAMATMSTAFYDDMVAFSPTSEIYAQNSQAAANRVRGLIADGVKLGLFRDIDGVFASQLSALAIEGIQSGELLRNTGLTAGAAFSELGDLLLRGLQHR